MERKKSLDSGPILSVPVMWNVEFFNFAYLSLVKKIYTIYIFRLYYQNEYICSFLPTNLGNSKT